MHKFDLANVEDHLEKRCREATVELLKRGWPLGEESKYDTNHALVLCRMHGFSLGLRFLYERMRLFREVLQVGLFGTMLSCARVKLSELILVVMCCCAVLCCAALRCAAMCCDVLRCAVLCCAVLRCAALRCAALRCAALRCAALCCAVLRCAALCCAVLCCAVLCCAVLCIAADAARPHLNQITTLHQHYDVAHQKPFDSGI